MSRRLQHKQTFLCLEFQYQFNAYMMGWSRLFSPISGRKTWICKTREKTNLVQSMILHAKDWTNISPLVEHFTLHRTAASIDFTNPVFRQEKQKRQTRIKFTSLTAQSDASINNASKKCCCSGWVNCHRMSFNFSWIFSKFFLLYLCDCPVLYFPSNYDYI